MTNVATEYKHVVLDENGVPTIEGSTMKVVELVTSHLAYGWSPEELHLHYPHIALGKIYSALAYYWDFREELDVDMRARLEKSDRLRDSASTSRIERSLPRQLLNDTSFKPSF